MNPFSVGGGFGMGAGMGGAGAGGSWFAKKHK